MNYLALLACIAPLYLIFYTYKHDRTGKEPKSLIFKLFIFGCLSILPILLVEIALTSLADNLYFSSEFIYNLFDAFIIAGVTEETFKFLFLNWGSWNNKNFDTSYDGIIYAVTVSMGFAIIENIEYCVTTDMSVVFTRSIMSIPAHCAFGVVMGIFYSKAKMYHSHGNCPMFQTNRKKSIYYAVLFHGLYDFCLMQGGIFIYIFVIVMIIIYRQLFKTIKVMAYNDHKIINQ